MADAADIASNTVEACTADAHRRQQARSAPEAQPDYLIWDGKHCVEEACGVLLPKPRRDAKRCRCVECQSRLERVLH